MASKIFGSVMRLIGLASDPSGADGDMWYRTDTDQVKARVNSTVETIFPPNVGTSAITSADANTFASAMTWTGTSYSQPATGTEVEGTFIAPRSGSVLFLYGCSSMAMSGSVTGSISFNVRIGAVIGSGTEVLSASDDRCVVIQNTSDHGKTGFNVVTGFTPGDTYNYRMRGRIFSSGTLTVEGGRIAVIPLIA